MLDADVAGRGQPEKLLHHVQQLADVPRPPISLESQQGLVGEGQPPFASIEKMSRQSANIFGPLSKWRNLKTDDAQPVKEIFAELAGGDHLRQVAVGRGNHADVHLALRLIRTHGLDLAVLEKPQEKRLHSEAHLADFVEEQRAAMRELELPALVPVGAGKTTLDVSKQLGFEERFRDAGAVHRHKRRMLAPGVAVHIAGDQVFAHTALAGDENLGATLGGPVGQREELGHASAGDNKGRFGIRMTVTFGLGMHVGGAQFKSPTASDNL